MDLKTFLRKIPKVELHCHLAGTVQASTFVELANKNNIIVPPYKNPEDLFDWLVLDEFLPIYRLISQSLQDRDDFRRTMYEALKVASENGVRYLEMFWNPTEHIEFGVPFEVSMDGMIDGINDARTDFGVEGRLIAAVDREKGPDLAVEMVELMIENRRDELIGIGADYNTTFHPPEAFWRAFRTAGNAGFYRTSHVSEYSHPARDVEAALEVLGCDRLDHGYRVLEDERITQRCVDDQIVFTVIPMADRAWIIENHGEYDFRKHVIQNMDARGLKIMLNSDDPGMMQSNIGDAYIMVGEYMRFEPGDFKRFVLNGIDGAWVDESTKRQWRAEWSQEINNLLSGLEEN